jgi:hypothetical protein
MAKNKTFAVVLSMALLIGASASALTVSGVTGATNVSIGVSGQSNASSTGSNASGSANVSANATAQLSVPLVVTRTDVNNSAVQASNVSAASVQNKQDLSGYIAARMQADANLTAVDTASDHVAVTYPEHAELFGFIPVTVNTTATTDASGNISLSTPWWALLTSTDQTDLQTNVQANVDQVLGANAQANTQLSASQQAQLVGAIESAMAMTASADASGSASTQ